MILSLMLALMLQQPAAPAEHEYADVVRINASQIYNKYVAEHHPSEAEKKQLKDLFRFKDFIGKSMDGRYVNFLEPGEKGYKPAKVLILSYVAEWCPNCNYEAPYLRDLYKKYNGRGLEIVGRSEYSEVAKMKAVIQKNHTPYPVITGSVVAYDARETIRLETFQYLLRSTLGDQRKWGTPFSIIILNGDVENPYIVMGEMKAAQINPLIEKALAVTKQ
jgi:thiol-disulfide isomerase/thioredoxin